jgi:tetratricopeptide (TPR) repeat protein
MLRKIFLAAFVLGISINLSKADFTDDFQSALQLYYNGKYAEAAEIFSGLSKRAPTPGSKSDALRYAVLSAIKVKQFDKAEELLPQMPRESTKKLCRMDLLLAQGKTQELVNSFKDEDLTQWSDSHIYDALLARGQAYRQLKQYAGALRDFRKAEEFTSDPGKKAGSLNMTGRTLQETGDDAQALVVWRRMEDISALKGYGIINDATASAARILAKQGKYDEALKEMEKIKPAESGYWHAQPLVVQAEIYAAQGKKTEALAKYEEALKGAPEDMKKSIADAIEKLNAK